MSTRKTASNPPQLKQFAGFWTLMGQPAPGSEWSIAEKVRRAQEVGFDAMGFGANRDYSDPVREAGLDYVCYIDANDETFEDHLNVAAKTGCARVNVQLWDHDTQPATAARTWVAMQPVAERLGLEIDLEVHRDTCTETPEKAWEIARLYEAETGRQCRFCFDFSHFGVVKHLSPPYARRLLDKPELIQLARQMHFRPFNGHHCQIPLTDGNGNLTPEAEHYLEFLDALIACWLEGDQGGETLYVCPEFGPVTSGYGLSVFTNVWEDAVRLRAETENIWKRKLEKLR